MELFFHLFPEYNHKDLLTSPEQEFVLRSNTSVQTVPESDFHPPGTCSTSILSSRAGGMVAVVFAVAIKST